MNRDKKQMLVLALLAVMILGVGAFQMMGGTAPPPPAAASSDEKAKREEQEKLAKEADAIKNPDFADPLDRRDPFQKASFAVKPVDPSTVPVVKNEPKVKKHFPPSRPLPDFEFGSGKGAKEGQIVPLAPPEPKFNYSLIGIISGANPGAVFADSTGNQKLVELGHGIDGDATLLSVSRDQVRVKFHAKTLVLTVGGNPSAK